MARCNTYVVESNNGKSFNYSEYSDIIKYTNNQLKQDFVSYNGAMYVCLNNVSGVNPEIDTANGTKKGQYWLQIIKGVKGKTGDTGPKGDSIIGPQGVPGLNGKSLEVEIHGDEIWIRQEGDTEWSKTNHLTPTSVYKPTLIPETGEIHWQLVKNPESSFVLGELKGDAGKSAYDVAVDNGFKGSEKDWLKSLIGVPGKPGKDGLSIVGPVGLPGKDGEDGKEVELSLIDRDGELWLAQNYVGEIEKTPIFNLNLLIGEQGIPGKTPILYKNVDGDLAYKYEDDDLERVLIKYNDYKGDSIEAAYVQDGYLYIKKTDDILPINTGYVRGPQGLNGREVILRLDRYSALTPEEKEAIKEGDEDIWTGTHIQWKYEGENWKSWRNLIQVNELLNIAISGIQLSYQDIVWAKQNPDFSWSVSEEKQDGYTLCHRILLLAYQTYYDERNVLHVDYDKYVDTLSEMYIPIQRAFTGATIDTETNIITFHLIDPIEGEITETISINHLHEEFIEFKEEISQEFKEFKEQVTDDLNKITSELGFIDKEYVPVNVDLQKLEDVTVSNALDFLADEKYRSEMPDELIVPQKIGGLPAGKTAEELKQQSISQILDYILFPELQPSITAPSATISIKNGFSNNGIYEVGATAPSLSNFTTSFSRGLSTVPGKLNLYRAGALIEDNQTFIYYGGNTSNKTLPEKITLGTMTYNYQAHHGVGDTLITSKGNIASVSPNPLPNGIIKSSAITINGTYPYFCNGATASTSTPESTFPTTISDTKLPLVTWGTTLVGAKFASEASTNVRLVFDYPSLKKITKVEFYNTALRQWDIFTGYKTSVLGNKTIQGNQISYNRLTTTSSLWGALQLRFTLANK